MDWETLYLALLFVVGFIYAVFTNIGIIISPSYARITTPLDVLFTFVFAILFFLSFILFNWQFGILCVVLTLIFMKIAAIFLYRTFKLISSLYARLDLKNFEIHEESRINEIKIQDVLNKRRKKKN